MSMGALQWALPKEEDLRFRQEVQFTTCLNAQWDSVHVVPLSITHYEPVLVQFITLASSIGPTYWVPNEQRTDEERSGEMNETD